MRGSIICCAAALVIATSCPAWAQDNSPTYVLGPGTSSSQVDDASEPAVATSDVSPRFKDAFDKTFAGVWVGLSSAMVLDTYTTFSVQARCPYCPESDPYVAPFLRHGPGLTYTAGATFDTGVMLLAARIRTAKRPELRKFWWAIPVGVAVGHVLAARGNMMIRPGQVAPGY